MQDPIITTFLFLFTAALVLGIPFMVLILGLLMLKSSRVTTSRVFDAGINLATIVAVIPAVMFLWFVPTIAFIVAFLGQDQLEPGVRMVIAAFSIVGFAFQIMFVRDTIRWEMRDKGLTFSQYIKRSFSREYRQKVQEERELSSQRVNELYSKLDDISSRPWAKKRQEVSDIAKKAEIEAAITQREKMKAEYQARPLITKSSLVTIALTFAGIIIISLLVGSYVGIEELLMQDRDTLFAFGNGIFIIGALLLIFGAISVLGLQTSRQAAVSIGAIAAGVTNNMLDQSAKDIARWTYTRIAWVSIFIAVFFIAIAFLIAVIYFPSSL